MPRTSSLDEVLSLRPSPPSPPLSTSPTSNRHGYWRVVQEDFGRKLAFWYALIYQCLSEHTELGEERDSLVAILYDFPLLYDMTGNWCTPHQVFSFWMSFIFTIARTDDLNPFKKLTNEYCPVPLNSFLNWPNLTLGTAIHLLFK